MYLYQIQSPFLGGGADPFFTQRFNNTLKHVGTRFGAMVRYCGVRFWVQVAGAGAGAIKKI